jgi:hypothetical protein
MRRGNFELSEFHELSKLENFSPKAVEVYPNLPIYKNLMKSISKFLV